MTGNEPAAYLAPARAPGDGDRVDPIPPFRVAC